MGGDHAGQPVGRGEAMVLGHGHDWSLRASVARLAQGVRRSARHPQPFDGRSFHFRRERQAAAIGDDHLPADLSRLAGDLGQV